MNFPGSTEADGYVVVLDTEESMAHLAAEKIALLEAELEQVRRVMALITDSEFLALNHESHRDSYGESLGRYYSADVVGPNSLVVVEDETLNGCVDKARAVILEAKQAGE